MKLIQFFATVGIAIGFAFNLPAQTWTLTAAPSYRQDWVALASSADGTKLIAGALADTYGLSTNSGITWVTNTQPQANSTYGSWSSLASSADGNTLVGISGNVIWISTNSGSSWLSNNLAGPLANGYVGLSADGSKLVAALGYSQPGPVFTSTNSGFTVTQTTAPTNTFNSLASSADGSKLFAAGYASQSGFGPGFIYASTNSGLDWALTRAPTNNMWVCIACSADGSKLVAGSDVAFVPGLIYGGVYTSTNYGMTWVSNNVPNADWRSVASSADGTMLVAAALNPAGLIYTSTNSGATWISNSVPAYSWGAVASSADGSKLVTAVGSGGGIYTSYVTPKPQLNLTSSSTNLAVTWTVPSTNFVLQQNSSLPTASWSTVTNPPVLNLTNLQNQVTLSPSAGSSFFRLKTP